MDLYSLLVRFEASSFYYALLIYFAWYPLATSVMWIFTSILFFRQKETGETDFYDSFDETDGQPMVSFVIPAYNEEKNIGATLAGVLEVNYSNFEVVVIDDCSTDGTLIEIEPYLLDARVRLVRKMVNEGKAMALNDAIPLTRGDLLFVMDADAIPIPDVLKYFVPHFRYPRCAAVTGNPRVATAIASCPSCSPTDSPRSTRSCAAPSGSGAGS